MRQGSRVASPAAIASKTASAPRLSEDGARVGESPPSPRADPRSGRCLAGAFRRCPLEHKSDASSACSTANARPQTPSVCAAYRAWRSASSVPGACSARRFSVESLQYTVTVTLSRMARQTVTLSRLYTLKAAARGTVYRRRPGKPPDRRATPRARRDAARAVHARRARPDRARESSHE